MEDFTSCAFVINATLSFVALTSISLLTFSHQPLSYLQEYGFYEEYEATGDPAQDLEYQRPFYASRMPDVVKKFIQYFRNVIGEGVIYEIQNLYENTFPKISDQHYDKRAWPDEREVATLIDKEKDNKFLVLYKELYFRHIHARLPGGPSLNQRVSSFFNYCDFFNLILSASSPVALELPDIWLWELVDEFVYQFQNFAQYRARLTDKSAEEMEQLLNNNSKVWNILCILNVFHSLVDMSNIKPQLEAMANGGDVDAVAGTFGRQSLYKMLGYFSLVGLLRVHSLLGDYYQVSWCLVESGTMGKREILLSIFYSRQLKCWSPLSCTRRASTRTSQPARSARPTTWASRT